MDEEFLELVYNTIATYEDAPSEVKNGYISIPITMLKTLYEYVEMREDEDEYDYWEWRDKNNRE